MKTAMFKSRQMKRKKPLYKDTSINRNEYMEGEPIELKVERIVSNKEPIKDGAPEIFTERAQGVLAAYNIRSDRWELAADAMDYVSRSKQAERDARAKPNVEENATKESGNNGGAESVHGEKGGK